MHPVITGATAALIGLLFLALSARVAGLRHSERIGIGDGGNKFLSRAIRAHGNLAEHAPLILLLMLCYELSGGAQWLLIVSGVTLVVARSLHALGLLSSAGTSFGRTWGVALTWLVLLLLSLANLGLLFQLA